MTKEAIINGKKITELSDMFFEYCKLKKENEDLKTYIQKMDKPEIKTIDSEIALKNIELQQENEELKKIFKKIDKLLDEALDAEVTDMEQSLDRLYTISEMIGKVLNDRD